MSSQQTSGSTWYKIGSYLFSQTPEPVLYSAEHLSKLPDFSVLDPVKFIDIVETAENFKVVPTAIPDVNMLTYKISGLVSEKETHCKIGPVHSQVAKDYNIVRGIIESPTKVDMTQYYKNVLSYKLAVPQFCNSLKRVCGIIDGISIIGSDKYLEFLPTDLSVPQDEELHIRELNEAIAQRVIESEDTKFYHITYNKKKLLIVQNDKFTALVSQKPGVSTNVAAICSKVKSVLSSNKKILVWEVGYQLHRDIKASSAGMHKISFEDPSKAVIVLHSLEAKPPVKIKLKQNLPSKPFSMSVMVPFSWPMKPEQKMKIYEVTESAISTGPVYLIEYWTLCKPEKTPSKKAKETSQSQKPEQQESWKLDRYALVPP